MAILVLDISYRKYHDIYYLSQNLWIDCSIRSFQVQVMNYGIQWRLFGGDCGCSLCNFAGEVNHQGPVLGIQLLHSLRFSPCDAM